MTIKHLFMSASAKEKQWLKAANAAATGKGTANDEPCVTFFRQSTQSTVDSPSSCSNDDVLSDSIINLNDPEFPTRAAADDIDVDGEDLNQTELSTLRIELAEKNALLKHIQKETKTEEKMQEERVLALEIEVEQLIDMRKKKKRNDAASIIQRDCLSASLVREKSTRYANIEISALQDLLSRVMAERDILAIKVRNVERILKETDVRQNTGIAKGDIIYQLTCKKCRCGTKTTIGKTSGDLKETVKVHFEDVCKMVSGEVQQGNKFMNSNFAKHIVGHFQNQNQGDWSDKKIFQWCQKNVKVELFRIELS